MNARRKKSPARTVPAKKPAAARKRPRHAAAAVARPVSGSTKGSGQGSTQGSTQRSNQGSNQGSTKGSTNRRAATGPREALAADCTIEHAPALHKRLAKILANRACVTLDLAAVRRCDTAGLQVLVAFVRERREAGRDVELKDAPDAFRSAAKLLGLTDVLGLKAAEAREGQA
jgi:ABC-type transporter Mla MlaB component